jgi:hypothetical protein
LNPLLTHRREHNQEKKTKIRIFPSSPEYRVKKKHHRQPARNLATPVGCFLSPAPSLELATSPSLMHHSGISLRHNDFRGTQVKQPRLPRDESRSNAIMASSSRTTELRLGRVLLAVLLIHRRTKNERDEVEGEAWVDLAEPYEMRPCIANANSLA